MFEMCEAASVLWLTACATVPQARNSVSVDLMLGFMQSPILMIFSAKFNAVNDCLPLTISCLFFSSLLFDIILLVSSAYPRTPVPGSLFSSSSQVVLTPKQGLKKSELLQTDVDLVSSLYSLLQYFFHQYCIFCRRTVFFNRSVNTVLTRTSDTWVLSINVKNKTKLSYRSSTLWDFILLSPNVSSLSW